MADDEIYVRVDRYVASGSRKLPDGTTVWDRVYGTTERQARKKLIASLDAQEQRVMGVMEILARRKEQ